MTEEIDGATQIGGFNRGLTAYGDIGFSQFLRGVFLAGAGHSTAELSQPVIGIANLASDYNPCHRGVPDLVEQVKQGVASAGGVPMVFPTMSLGESFLSPTSMLYRNLLAMETEELLAAQPMDAAVLIGGCDKTVPAQLMASGSAEIPTIIEVTGPMLVGTWEGERVGACTDCRRLWAKYRAGDLSHMQIKEAQGSLATTAGTCMVMGTASSMAIIAETLGMMLPGGATPPAPTGDRLRHAFASGVAAVDLAKSGRTARDILTKDAFVNAATALAAVGGSTNAIIHLLAISRRAGVDLSLDEIGEIASRTPLLLDLKPSGSGYMEDFHRAGGVPALLSELRIQLATDQVGVSGRTLADVISEVPERHSQTTIRSAENPVRIGGSLTVLRGSLAPDGAVLKVSAASPDLLNHVGPALVFESAEDAARRIDDPDLDVTPDTVLVLRNEGPVGSGMPEAGSLPIPRKLAEQGVTDLVRVSDARMSGTSYGTVVLHCAPESAIGGPLSLVKDGDLIRLDAEHGTIDLLVDEVELERRRTALQPRVLPTRGWKRLYATTVQQANFGADLDFLSETVARTDDLDPILLR